MDRLGHAAKMRVTELFAMLNEESLPGVQEQMVYYTHLTFTPAMREARKEHRKKQRQLEKEKSNDEK